MSILHLLAEFIPDLVSAQNSLKMEEKGIKKGKKENVSTKKVKKIPTSLKI